MSNNFDPHGAPQAPDAGASGSADGIPEGPPGAPEVRPLRARILEVTHAIGKAVSGELDMDTLCDLVVENLARVFEPETLALLFLAEESGELYLKRFLGPSEGADAKFRGKVGRGATGTAFAERRVVCLRDGDPALRDPAQVGPFVEPSSVVAVPITSEDAIEPLPPRSSRAEAAVPLMAEAKVKGVVALAWPSAQARPTEEDLHMLEVVSHQIATAFDNAWLYGEIKRLNANLEMKVRARTAELDAKNAELARALEELKQTQIQLVQNEKMASIGQLTAGIAHEINNPLAYGISNVAMARERLGALRVYAQVLDAIAGAAQAPSADARRIAAMSLIDELGALATLREDINALRADLAGLGAEEAAELCVEFLHYVRLRAERALGPEGVDGIDRLLERSDEGLGRVKQIVLDLRTFSRLDEAQFQAVDLDEGIAGTLTLVDHLVKERRVFIEHHRGMARPYPCFPAKLNQVVLNLLTNGVQATPVGGRVVVTTRETADGPVIEVSDTGCGIPPEHLPKIFDPFFTTKPIGQGTGLGLSISYRIVEEHGGTFSVKSEPGAGTTFTIQLPVRPGERSSA